MLFFLLSYLRVSTKTLNFVDQSNEGDEATKYSFLVTENQYKFFCFIFFPYLLEVISELNPNRMLLES